MIMSSTARTAVIEVSGVHWASSKAVTEAVLSRRPGVLAVDANPVSQTATVVYDPDRTSVTVLAGWVRDCGYHCAGQSVPDHVCDPMAEPTDHSHDGHPAQAGTRPHQAAHPAPPPTARPPSTELDTTPPGSGPPRT
jgi:Cu2+-exporting ATPase